MRLVTLAQTFGNNEALYTSATYEVTEDEYEALQKQSEQWHPIGSTVGKSDRSPEANDAIMRQLGGVWHDATESD